MIALDPSANCQPTSLVMSVEDIPKLKSLCKKTPAGGTFEYRGGTFLREYAMYVIEFLESRLKKK